MIRALLGELQKGNVASYRTMAEAIGTSRGMVEQMLMDLEQRGYVARLSPGCQAASSCSGCKMGCTIPLNAPDTLWTITEKGKALLQ